MELSQTQKQLLVGIDGGGTHTRVLCTNLFGIPLSYGEAGGGNPDHNPEGEANVQNAIAEAIQKAGGRPEDVVSMVGGLAGYDEESLLVPAAERIRLPGMTCPFTVVNDGNVAHAGAFGIAPGILHVSGSGSVTTYIDKNRKVMRNYDFLQYSHSGGRHLGYGAVFALITQKIDKLDQPLVDAALKHFEVDSLEGLQSLESKNHAGDYKALLRFHGQFAPYVTHAAANGSPIAQEVCRRSAFEVAQAIGLVAPRCHRGTPIKVVLHGSVANCNYFKNAIVRLLMEQQIDRFEIVSPMLIPVAGAILLAAEQSETADIDMVMRNLLHSSYAGKGGG